MYRYLKNQKGAALVWSIIVLLVLSILGVALLNISLSEAKHSIYSQRKVQAYYLAMSGVEAGFTKAKNITSKNTANEIATEASSQINSGSISGTGNYVVSFAAIGDSGLKITSTGTVPPGINDTVSLIAEIVPADSEWVPAPNHWLQNRNTIAHGVSDGDYAYMNKGIAFTGPYKSPSAGGPSTFRASLILFQGIDRNGVTLQQQPNNDVTIDTKVVFFNEGIVLTTSNRYLKLNLTAPTAIYNDFIWGSITNVNPVDFAGRPGHDEYLAGREGFQNIVRYNDFIYSDTYPGYEHYPFVRGDKSYGIVYFEQGVRYGNNFGSSDLVIPPGYYFFKSGTNIAWFQTAVSPTATVLASNANNHLIRINNDDPIIGAIDRLRSNKVKVNQKIIYQR